MHRKRIQGEEYLPILFEPFSREHNTTTGKVGGTKFTVTLMHKIADKKYYSQEIETVKASDMRANLRGKHVLLA